MSDVTHLLNAIEAGDPHAAGQLWTLVYDELRKLAAAQMAREEPGQTLDATALVHEAYIRLVRAGSVSDGRDGMSHPVAGAPGSAHTHPVAHASGSERQFANRRHFFAAAAEAMRRILVESARRKARLKHGGAQKRVELSEAIPAQDDAPDELLALDEALEQLAKDDPAAAELVKLRYFAGLSVEEAADTLGMARATAYRHWTFARAWLALRVRGESE